MFVCIIVRSSLCFPISVQNVPLLPHHLASCHLHIELITPFFQRHQQSVNTSISYRYIFPAPSQAQKIFAAWLDNMEVSPPLTHGILESSITLIWFIFMPPLCLTYCLEQSRCSINIKEMYLHPSRLLLVITDLSYYAQHLVPHENRGKLII